MMPERQCGTCTQQEEWGCKGRKVRPTQPDEDERESWENPAFLPLEIDGKEIYNCPRQHLLEDPHYYSIALKFYAMYMKGFLPQAGAVCDQSNKAIEIFRILDDVNAMCDHQQLEETKRPKGDPTAAGR
jgi:hypothetical protein